MTKKNTRGVHLTIGSAVLALAPILLIGGCGEDPKTELVSSEKETTVDTTPKKASVTKVKDLMLEYGIDPRIVLEENDAPDTNPERIAILTFFHNMITADKTKFPLMLSSQDRMEFSGLQETGIFEEAVMDISKVKLQGGSSPDYQPAVVAIMFMQSTNDLPAQLWTYQVDVNGGTSTFTSAPTPLEFIDKYGADGQVDTWYRLLGEEDALAMALDEALEIPKINASVELETPASGSGGGPSSPGRGVPDRKPASPPKFNPGSN